MSLASRSAGARAAIGLMLLILAVAAALMLLRPLFLLLALTLLLYAATGPVMNAFVRRGMKRETAALFAMSVMMPLVLGAGLVLFPMVTAQVQALSERAELLDERLLGALEHLERWSAAWIGFHFDAGQAAQTLVEWSGSRLDAAGRLLRSYFNDVAYSLLLVPLFTYFLLRDFRMLRNRLLEQLPNRYFETGWLIYDRASTQLVHYLRGLFVQLVIMTLVSAFGFSLVGIDYSALLGLLVGLLNLIPIFGIAIAKIPPVVAVLLSDQPEAWRALAAFAVVVVAQTVDGLVVLPRILARASSLHPLTIMAGVVLAGFYFGFLGLVLAVPVMFTTKVVFTELLRGLRLVEALSPDAGAAAPR